MFVTIVLWEDGTCFNKLERKTILCFLKPFKSPKNLEICVYHLIATYKCTNHTFFFAILRFLLV